MSKLDIAKEKCVHCGACTAACSEGALYMETKDWTLGFDELLCTHCRSCIKACPLRAINIESSI
ncbi:MAG TPA: 4Fe-4S binding protein [Clostridia bacterium]|nr:4Fe-4S binding protein [Clostridia bacterium]